MFDLIIRSDRVVTPTGVAPCDVAIANGKIAAVAAAGTYDATSTRRLIDARGKWERAHTLAQDVDDTDGAWVHAYLHRKEGDAGNAADWYRRANQPIASDSLDAEWHRIATALLR